ncbi:hypothetical protein [Mycobacterium sp. IS-1556]|uniref:hypothetical protein n=1 Tax=Mycobacterium sp. IS-1556 TaxID=1772276 RepID=UPI00074172CA|nr:hypothetical protein [Mycobacterium sp. IS-1556]KUH90632.1 hypothetical protein AU187_24480 [Mycobacterium sp. IS-1556]
MSSSALDAARSARITAALAANDNDGAQAVIAETMSQDGPVGLAGLVLATATRLAAIAKEFYDIDCQRILDMYAMEAIAFAEKSE